MLGPVAGAGATVHANSRPVCASLPGISRAKCLIVAAVTGFDAITWLGEIARFDTITWLGAVAGFNAVARLGTVDVGCGLGRGLASLRTSVDPLYALGEADLVRLQFPLLRLRLA